MKRRSTNNPMRSWSRFKAAVRTRITTRFTKLSNGLYKGVDDNGVIVEFDDQTLMAWLRWHVTNGRVLTMEVTATVFKDAYKTETEDKTDATNH